jgi:broad specificity phosphatase PhoE
MTLTLVRHSEVIEKYQGCYNGHLDISLSQKGLEDAKKLGKKLQEQHFDIIYCSDLLRAKETLNALELNSTNIIYTPDLREKSWGEHEGMSFEEITQTGLKYENFQQWINALDGEPTKNYIQRIAKFLQNLKQTQDKNILIITHSGVIKTMLHITQEISLEEAFTTQVEYSQTINLKI